MVAVGLSIRAVRTVCAIRAVRGGMAIDAVRTAGHGDWSGGAWRFAVEGLSVVRKQMEKKVLRRGRSGI